jgi:hypothetical protein
VEEVLISAAFYQRPLQNQSHDLYKDAAGLRKEWEEVAKETGMEKELLNKSVLVNHLRCCCR